MSKKEYKKVTVEVRKEVWIALKVQAVRLETSLQSVMEEMIEKGVSRIKSKSADEENNK